MPSGHPPTMCLAWDVGPRASQHALISVLHALDLLEGMG
jgi:hypothetical protein